VDVEDKGTGVDCGLTVRAEDRGSRSDTEENDSRLLIFPRPLIFPAASKRAMGSDPVKPRLSRGEHLRTKNQA